MDSVEYLNPDSVNGLNLYVYCGNNPISYRDPSGQAFLSFLLGLGVAAIIGATVGALGNTAGIFMEQTYSRLGIKNKILSLI